MAYTGEVGFAQLIKYGEVTCGDAVEVIRNEDNVVIVLSDGLGSGVKANILSNLTAKIASKSPTDSSKENFSFTSCIKNRLTSSIF